MISTMTMPQEHIRKKKYSNCFDLLETKKNLSLTRTNKNVPYQWTSFQHWKTIQNSSYKTVLNVTEKTLLNIPTTTGQSQRKSTSLLCQNSNNIRWKQTNWSHPFTREQTSYEPSEEVQQKFSSNSKPLRKEKFLEKRPTQFWKKLLKVQKDSQFSLGPKEN